MNIYEKMKKVLEGQENQFFTLSEIRTKLNETYGVNSSSVIPSDFCYNRLNKGITFQKHLFEYAERNGYRYLGENYPYTGLIYRRSSELKRDIVVGEWVKGDKFLGKTVESTSFQDNLIEEYTPEEISLEQIKRLYSQYSEILKLELSLLNCKATELRHLTGRIGEFICAIETNGNLARQTNQHGFDVISNERRISVKTTAQTENHITINQRTFEQFDDFFVVQYLDGEFKTIFYGPKEEIIPILKVYNDKYELPILKLKSLKNRSLIEK
ncbi:DUF7225 domain-containing protein [Priestia koreensis]|uniref:DUF7225 domain-containing protein n=1 Tax=Priestia koreensis TaxID=284581 RepID=UPI001F5A6B0C|nr:hypothetical protein [Priestia koreensis]UNL87436.1 hypothetical protein IE339_24265 [Priestia koreensis]